MWAWSSGVRVLWAWWLVTSLKMAAKNKSLKPLHLAGSVKELNEKSASNMIQSANPKL